MYNEELQGFTSSLQDVRIVKIRKWEGNVAHMKDNTHKRFWGKT